MAVAAPKVFRLLTGLLVTLIIRSSGRGGSWLDLGLFGGMSWLQFRES